MEQVGFDAAELALLTVAKAHRMLLACGLLRDADPAGISVRALGRVQGPHACGQRVARRTVARPASARTTRYPPDRMLHQYIGAAIENLASRMNGKMITHTPSSTLANCNPA